MNHRLLMIVAATALLISSSLCHAQAPTGGVTADGASGNAPPAASAPTPSADPASPTERTPPANRDEATDTTNDAKSPEVSAGVKSTPPDDKVQRDNGDSRASDAIVDGKQMPASGR